MENGPTVTGPSLFGLLRPVRGSYRRLGREVQVGSNRLQLSRYSDHFVANP
jgi:hypothetical protein